MGNFKRTEKNSVPILRNFKNVIELIQMLGEILRKFQEKFMEM